MRSSWFIFTILIMFISFVDITIFKLYINPTIRKGKLKTYIKDIHWLVYGLFILSFLSYTLMIPRIKGPEMYLWFSRLIAAFSIVYIPKLIILFFSILGALQHLGSIILLKKIKKEHFIINKVGTVLSIFLLIAMIYGFTIGRYDYRVKTIEIQSDKIPPSFDGFKIVQISDFHLGSFGKNYPGVDKAVKMVNALKPDIITFTGDMVNNFASEMGPWMKDITSLKAKYGKYSILGNHDYGHYVRWDDPTKDAANLANLIKYQRECGFDMLNNEHRYLRIGKDSIAIAGVENWGLPPFPAYGKLHKALVGINAKDFTLLLSHDPNHWDAEVKATNVDLMLAGHTHAMQMGIEIGTFKWSPAQYLNKYWDGLYSDNNKDLYVNRGLGYIALPGRILQRPEITVIILKSKQQ